MDDAIALVARIRAGELSPAEAAARAAAASETADAMPPAAGGAPVGAHGLLSGPTRTPAAESAINVANRRSRVSGRFALITQCEAWRR